MAKITAGTKLEYGDGTVTSGVVTIPSTWTKIPGVSSTPDLGTAPSTIDVTDLGDLVRKRAIAGLIDQGMLEFEAFYDTDLVTAATAATADPGNGKARCFAITIPQTSERFWWVGKLTPVYPAAAEVDAALTATLSITVESDIVRVALP